MLKLNSCSYTLQHSICKKIQNLGKKTKTFYTGERLCRDQKRHCGEKEEEEEEEEEEKEEEEEEKEEEEEEEEEEKEESSSPVEGVG